MAKKNDNGAVGNGKQAAATISGDALKLVDGATIQVVDMPGAGEDRVVISAEGYRDVKLKASEFKSFNAIEGLGEQVINIDAGAHLTIEAALLHNQTVHFVGDGTLDIVGLTIEEAVIGSPLEANYELEGVLPNIDVPFTVNGSEADAIKALWDVWDDQYVKAREEDSEEGYYVDEINEGMIRTGIRYVEYLENGGEPFTDFGAKVTGSRDQSLHDNLLGNLNRDSLEGRNLPEALEAELLALIPDEYEDRPVFSGNLNTYGSATHDAVRAFDYEKGWERPDYIDQDIDATLDPAAQDDGEMYAGNGNSVDGFNVVRHEGAGVELALKAKVRGGEDYDPVDVTEGGVVVYEVESGPGATSNRADWNFDFSISTGLNGNHETVTDFNYRLLIDTDASEEADYLALSGTDQDGDGTVEWATSDGTVVIGDDGGTEFVTQNSQNFGFGYIRNQIDSDATEEGIQPYDFGEGQFDIRLEAYADVDLVVANQIRVNVSEFDLI